MWLILSEEVDRDATVLATRLRGCGLNPLVHATAEQLGFARWAYRSGTAGESSELHLPGEIVVSSGDLRGVVNRLLAVPASALAQVAKPDRDYARAELLALYISWLNGLPCPVLNRPTASTLCGFWPDNSEWIRRAFSAGLPAEPFAWRSRGAPDAAPPAPRLEADETIETLFVLDGKIIGGAVPANLVKSCARFALRTGNRLMGMLFAAGPEGPRRLLDATPVPYLSAAPDETIAALAERLVRS